MSTKNKCLLRVTTSYIYSMRSIFTMLKDISKDEVEIIFMKGVPQVQAPSKQAPSKQAPSKQAQQKHPSEENRMLIRLVNTHKTIICIIKISESSFSEFTMADDKYACWLNIDDIIKCMKGVNTTNYTITFEVSANDDRVVNLIFKQQTDKSGNNNVPAESYPLVVIDREEDAINLQFSQCDAKITVPPIFLRDICAKALSFGGDMISIACCHNRVIFEYKMASSNRNAIKMCPIDEDCISAIDFYGSVLDNIKKYVAKVAPVKKKVAAKKVVKRSTSDSDSDSDNSNSDVPIPKKKIVAKKNASYSNSDSDSDNDSGCNIPKKVAAKKKVVEKDASDGDDDNGSNESNHTASPSGDIVEGEPYIRTSYPIANLLTLKTISNITDKLTMEFYGDNKPLTIRGSIEEGDNIVGRLVILTCAKNDDISDYHEKTEGAYKDQKASMK